MQFYNCRCNPNASTPILTDGLMSLMTLSKPTASNEADWREARMWLQEMAGMGLHRIEPIMDGMTLILPTKLKYKAARGQSHISRRQFVLTPGSRMFDGPKKFLWSPIRFNERNSYDQVTQGKTSVGELFT